jgi:hypothetical protein
MNNNAMLKRYIAELKSKSVILATKHRLVVSLREKLRDQKRNYLEYSQILNYLQVQEKKEHSIEKEWYFLANKIKAIQKKKMAY